jgi:O-antigen/teichoic acid export membrane protein
MILVKHYFDAHTAGIYGSLSVLGKIIFYLTSPIVGVMFPLSVAKRAKGEKTLNTFLLSILFSGLLSLMALVIYALFPLIVVTTLYGSSYSEGVRYLLPFGIFAALYSLIAYTINYLLSLEYTFASVIIACAAIVQIIGIIIFHSTIFQVVNVSIVVSFIFLSILLFYGLLKYQKV